jgi:hypothetical protein
VVTGPFVLEKLLDLKRALCAQGCSEPFKAKLSNAAFESLKRHFEDFPEVYYALTVQKEIHGFRIEVIPDIDLVPSYGLVPK